MTGATGSTRAGGVVLADRYEVVRHIARGGMADVYEATDRQLGRRVAVKRFRGASPQDRPRFDAEVLVLARLNHPNLVQVYDAGEHDGESFVVMELVDGPSLQDVLAERGALPPDDVAALGATLAGALAYVHDQGIVHRDVTPANVLCGRDGRPRLADFGIARLVDTSRITATATTIGTAAYMAPEQLEGHDVTPAADVYALGLVLLEALAGRPGFQGTSAEVALARLARDPDTTTGVPARWADLLTEMTRRDPSARPRVQVVGEHLRLLRSGAAPAGAPPVAAGPIVGAAAAAASTEDPTVPLATGVDGPTVPLSDALDGPTVVLTPGAGVGQGQVDGFVGTRAAPVVARARAPEGGGTIVMPAVLRPGSKPKPTAARPRHVLWGLVAGLVAALLIGLVAGSGGGIEVPTTTTLQPVAVAPSTTVAPTTTTAPADPAASDDGDEGRGSGKGKGQGQGRDDD